MPVVVNATTSAATTPLVAAAVQSGPWQLEGDPARQSAVPSEPSVANGQRYGATSAR